MRQVQSHMVAQAGQRTSSNLILSIDIFREDQFHFLGLRISSWVLWFFYGGIDVWSLG